MPVGAEWSALRSALTPRQHYPKTDMKATESADSNEYMIFNKPATADQSTKSNLQMNQISEHGDTCIDRTNGQREEYSTGINQRRERERENAQTGLLVDDHQASGFMLHNCTARETETEEDQRNRGHAYMGTEAHCDKSDKGDGRLLAKRAARARLLTLV
ncbi:hypothetical protein C8Q74DRAFT_1219110 [Fomes fomentarius]|nr:hypothetical protein C8Q74DRAFT_1219110 [Fomes fomentarius]